MVGPRISEEEALKTISPIERLKSDAKTTLNIGEWYLIDDQLGRQPDPRLRMLTLRISRLLASTLSVWRI